MLLGFLLHATAVHKADQPAQSQPSRLAADEDVGRCGLVGGQIELLVNDGDAQLLGVVRALDLGFLPVQEDAPGVPAVRAREDFHQRGLAGAVFTDQRQYLTGRHLEVHVVQRLHTGEGFRDTLHAQYHVLLVQRCPPY